MSESETMKKEIQALRTENLSLKSVNSQMDREIVRLQNETRHLHRLSRENWRQDVTAQHIFELEKIVQAAKDHRHSILRILDGVPKEDILPHNYNLQHHSFPTQEASRKVQDERGYKTQNMSAVDAKIQQQQTQTKISDRDTATNHSRIDLQSTAQIRKIEECEICFKKGNGSYMCKEHFICRGCTKDVKGCKSCSFL